MHRIATEYAPKPVGPYSQAIAAGGLLFTSGQIGIDPSTGLMPEDVATQTEIALKNLCAVLSAGGVSPENIVSVTVYLTNMGDFSIMNEIYSKTFEEPYPARTCVGVNGLPKNAKIMADAIGHVE